MAKIKLAEALLLRKQLQLKVDQLRQIDNRDLFETKVRRQQAAEGIDDVVAQVPLLKMSQMTHAFDWHSKRLRKVDALIQQANWTTEIEVDGDMIEDYVDPELPKR